MTGAAENRASPRHGLGGRRVGRLGVRLAAELGDHHGLLARGRQQTVRECLDAELTLTCTTIRTTDFLEGVRAALADKDPSPTREREARGGQTLPA